MQNSNVLPFKPRAVDPLNQEIEAAENELALVREFLQLSDAQKIRVLNEVMSPKDSLLLAIANISRIYRSL